jgi:hypothetical protein
LIGLLSKLTNPSEHQVYLNLDNCKIKFGFPLRKFPKYEEFLKKIRPSWKGASTGDLEALTNILEISNLIFSIHLMQ